MKKPPAKTKIVSFDVDGTLVDAQFNDLVWLEEIPRLYAEKERLSFKEAYGFVLREYEKVGEKDLRWYDMNHWLRHFGVRKSYAEILRQYAQRIKVYPEVERTLSALHNKFPMIVITLMPREFLEFKLEKLGDYFFKTFSTISDFKSVKTEQVYREICKRLNIAEHELLHIGDSWEADYVAPTEAGVKALCVDRDGKRNGCGLIKGLDEILTILQTGNA